MFKMQSVIHTIDEYLARLPKVSRCCCSMNLHKGTCVIAIFELVRPLGHRVIHNVYTLGMI